MYFLLNQFTAVCRFFSFFSIKSILLSLTLTGKDQQSVPASKECPYENILQSQAHSLKMWFLVAMLQRVLEEWLGATHLLQPYPL